MPNPPTGYNNYNQSLEFHLQDKMYVLVCHNQNSRGPHSTATLFTTPSSRIG